MTAPAMVGLLTDYGEAGPYVGQLEAALLREQPAARVIRICSDLPRWDPGRASYLVAALAEYLPAEIVLLCVVDPGVGSFADTPVVVHVAGRWLVGPNNGLFHTLLKRHPGGAIWDIEWRPPVLSASFHGRDLYAPVAARLAAGSLPQGAPSGLPVGLSNWPEQLAEVVYIDHYGNAVSGLSAAALDESTELVVSGRRLRRARTFASVAPHEPFWYENSLGLVEIAANRDSAALLLSLEVGSVVSVG